MKLYYVYTHSIKSNGQVFYVGCSKKNPKRFKERFSNGLKTEFERAYKKGNRTDLWNEVVRNNEYVVKIEKEFDTIEEAYNLEIELIKKYGRILYDKNGILVNLYEGGGKQSGIKRRNIKVVQMDLNGNHIKTWDEVKHIQEQLGFLKTNIVKCCRKKQITAYGFTWKYLNNNSFDHVKATASRVKDKKPLMKIKAINLKTNEVLFFNSAKDASDKTLINTSCIYKSILKKRKTFNFQFFAN